MVTSNQMILLVLFKIVFKDIPINYSMYNIIQTDCIKKNWGVICCGDCYPQEIQCTTSKKTWKVKDTEGIQELPPHK